MNWLIYTCGILIGVLAYACFSFRGRFTGALVLVLGVTVGPKIVEVGGLLVGIYDQPAWGHPFYWIAYVVLSLMILAISAATILAVHILKRLKG